MEKKRKQIKRICSMLLCIIICISSMPLTVKATQTKVDKFNKDYTLNGDGAHDIYEVAEAQLGKLQTNLEYTEAWCADFVSDCAELAGVSNVIPRDGNCVSLKKKISGTQHLKNSGYIPVHGDILFLGTSETNLTHVGIVDKTIGSTVYYIDGNNTQNRPTWVHYSSRTFSRTDFWGVITPNYEKSQPSEFSINLTENQYISSTVWGIGGMFTNGGTYPWLELYIDYGKVAETAPNPQGEYLFIQDSTKYADGKHIVGVKRRNQDGLDYTEWRNIIIDNTNPSITDVSVSEVTNENYTVTCRVSDNEGIDRVMFPSWHETKTGANAVWYRGIVINGVASCTIPISELGDELGDYNTHIYAYDKAENRVAVGGVVVNIDKNKLAEFDAVNIGTNFYGYIENSSIGGKVLTVNASGKIVNQTDTKADFQRWKFIRNADGSYCIESKADGRCLDNEGASGALNSSVQVYENNASSAQQWFIVKNQYGSYYLYPKCSTVCVLDLANFDESDGAQILIHTFNASKAQRFHIIDEEPVVKKSKVNLGEDFYAAIGEFGMEGKVVSESSGNVVSQTDRKADTQRWRFLRNSDGTYRIMSKAGNGYLSNTDGSNNSNVELSSVDNAASQKWTVYDAGGESYYLQPATTTECVLDLQDFNSSENANIAVHQYNSCLAQRYTITQEKINVSQVTLAPSELSFTTVGESKKVTAAVLPANATNKGISFSSSNSTVATVDTEGNVTAKASGTAVITVQSKDNISKQAVCQVKVNIVVEPSELQLNKNSIVFTEKGSSQQLTATVLPSNATNKNVSFSSSNTSVATVDASGKITAVANGTAVITVRAERGNLTEICYVTVDSPIAVTTLVLDKQQLNFVKYGISEKLRVTVLPENATNKTVSWSSSNTAIAVVDTSGNVEAAGNGIAVITARTPDGKVSASCRVTVSVPVQATEVKLDKNKLIFTELGVIQKLSATVLPENTANKNIIWSSSDKSVVIVDSNGNAVAAGNGTAKITAQSVDGAAMATCEITVNIPVKVNQIQLERTELNFDKIGSSTGILVTLFPVNVSNKKIICKSSNEAVAAVVSSGVLASQANEADATITAVGNGTATITIQSEDGGAIAICQVTVKTPVKVSEILLDKSSLTFTELGSTQNLNVTVLPSNADDKKVTFSSSDETIAFVDETGNITARKEGSAVITVQNTDKTITAECQINVKTTVVANEIFLNQNVLTFMEKGSKKQLIATILPESAEKQEIIFESSNKSVATVDEEGTVTAQRNGTAVITAQSKDGTLETSCQVTVRIKEKITQILLTQTELTFTEFGKSQKLTTVVFPQNAENEELMWETSNGEVVKVDSDGTVTAAENGTAVVTVRNADGTVTSECLVTVAVQVPVSEVLLEQKALTFTELNNSRNIGAAVLPENATEKMLVYSSSNPEVATVDQLGNVTAVGEGNTLILVTTKDGKKGNICNVVVELSCQHKLQKQEYKEATCLEDGNEEYYICSECGKCFSSQSASDAIQIKDSVIKAKGHKWTEWITVKEATVTSKGEERRICLACGEQERREIEQLQEIVPEPEIKNGFQDEDGGVRYYKNGKAVVSSWVKVDKAWYYMEKNGYMATNWKKLGKTWYYLGENGKMITGWKQISKVWYFFNNSGKMLTGWQKLNKVWYYFKSSGDMVTGWYKVGGTWYYAKNSGAMVTGWYKVGGSWYYAKSSGAMVTGWYKVGGTWYYANSSGKMLTGWKKLNRKWYYLRQNGKMATGWIKVNGIEYFMNSQGVWTGVTR